ncbi:hypothetical protein VKI21_06030 [Cyanobacterium aponinum UTEX 3222]|uniref:Uncharacterized protein n=1 Tax=Cyanobacterium aponinum (strain PCC 10605) TaxID=755178 RepID=K9Z7R9_CYAAP|nr:hypothetical protein Cyan10605_2704 [Cyanobacterium aponinum PCC 10605]WRL43241.1 hypothetical protein VKI21_06030 [Cyanobacterium aponinum UTEX 3222]
MYYLDLASSQKWTDEIREQEIVIRIDKKLIIIIDFKKLVFWCFCTGTRSQY